MFDVLLWIVLFALGIFTLVVMWTVFQMALAAREYYERQNRQWHGRPTQFDR